jgi:hypothetical protein
MYPVNSSLIARVYQIERCKENGRVTIHYQVVHPLRGFKNAPVLSCPLSTFGRMVQQAEEARDFEVLKEVEYVPASVTQAEPPWAQWTRWCRLHYQRFSAFLLMIWRDEGNIS